MGTCISSNDYEEKEEKKYHEEKKQQAAEMVYGNDNAGIARQRCMIPVEELYANLTGKQTDVLKKETMEKERTHCEGFEKEVHHDDDDDNDDDDDEDGPLSPERGEKEKKLSAGVSEGVCSDPRSPLGTPLGTHPGTWCVSW